MSLFCQLNVLRKGYQLNDVRLCNKPRQRSAAFLCYVRQMDGVRVSLKTVFMSKTHFNPLKFAALPQPVLVENFCFATLELWVISKRPLRHSKGSPYTLN